jgi:glycosyltransferase involved in cell wall biosynthesis
LPIAILATMTRAVWLSFAGTVLMLIVLSKSRVLRRACIASVVVTVAGLAVVLSSGDGGALGERLEERGPVDYRAAVYAGGWEMFLERPWMGWGFHQMPSELPRHVSGYGEKILYPHNTYLELLVEHGMVGLALYLWLMWELWRLRRGAIPEREKRGFLDSQFHRIWPVLLAVYWVNAARGGDELSICERTAVHDGRDAGGAAATGGGRSSMLTVAYLANEFPSPVEPYVGDEIEELRGRGVRVIAATVRKPRMEGSGEIPSAEIQLLPLRAGVVFQAIWLVICSWTSLLPLLNRILLHGSETPWLRLKALAHTFLGACYAVLLKERGAEHIHVHHGYFGSWIAMTAARMLGVKVSLTLHGSDLLLHGTYLDVKLQNCSFCMTVSEYNRNYILRQYPEIDPSKVLVARLGVEIPAGRALPEARTKPTRLTLLAVGRLHAVKDHAFLIQACSQLRALDVEFECFIAGEGPERHRLESLIQKVGLDDRVILLGHVPRGQMDSLYDRADVMVLTSRSEGIPLVVMEAMARGKVVLAPAITGIPELVIPGKTGFLYEPSLISNFVDHLLFIRSLFQEQGSAEHPLRSHRLYGVRQLDWIRHAARVQVLHNFNRKKNLESFAD